MIWLYNILITLTALIWAPMLALKARKRKEQPNWKERYGDLRPNLDRSRPVVWIHAVSVGEVIAAEPVLGEIRKQAPDIQIVLTCTTSTGHATARERIVKQNLADHLHYFPIDVARFMWQATYRVQAHATVLFETELWLNFLYFSKAVESTNLLVNGRISDRSLRRARWVQFFYATVFQYLDHVLAQSNQDAERLKFLGAKHVEVVGNTKFDQAQSATAEDRQRWRQELGVLDDELLLVIGSTRGEAEEQFVLDALRSVDRSKLVVVHAPRHVENAAQLADRVRSLEPQVGLRSKGETARYLVLDTYGELANLYAAADFAIIGGGFEKLGGQNLIQPLAAGVPVLHGKHMHNFRDVASMADQAGASVSVETPAELAQWLQKWMQDPSDRQRRGAQGAELVKQHQGASHEYAERIIRAARESFAIQSSKKKA